MNGSRDQVALLLRRPSERAPAGIVRNCLLGLAIGALLIALDLVRGTLGTGGIVGDLAAGISMAFFGWGAERLWYSTIAPVFNRPFSPAAYLTRLPFWYFAGAIGYTAALLIEKKTGMRLVDDIPVKRLFTTGGEIGILVQIPLQLIVYRSVVRRRKPSSPPDEKGRELHDTR